MAAADGVPPQRLAVRDRKMNIDEVVERFTESAKSVAIGPSSLESLASEEVWPNGDQKIAVPDNLTRLLSRIREGSSEHRLFLIRLVRYFRARPWQARHYEDQDNRMVDRILNVISAFERDGRLIVIDEGVTDPEIEESLGDLYPGRAFEIALSPIRNFLRDYLVRVYSWSKHTGGVILECTRRVFSDMGHHIATLQLPDRLDHYVGLKSRCVGRMFGFRGGRAVKLFVGCAISIAGLRDPAASVAGVVIAFADP